MYTLAYKVSMFSLSSSLQWYKGHHIRTLNQSRGFRSVNQGKHNESGVHQLRLTAGMHHSDTASSDKTYKHSLNLGLHQAMLRG